MRRSNKPAPKSDERSAKQSEGREPQESWLSGDGRTDSSAPQYPEARAGLNVKPPEGVRGGATTKVSARSDVRMLWRDEAQEGIDGRDPCGSGGSTDSSRDQGPEAGQFASASLRGGAKHRVTTGGYGPREGSRS